jgi:hypothetical protein
VGSTPSIGTISHLSLIFTPKASASPLSGMTSHAGRELMFAQVISQTVICAQTQTESASRVKLHKLTSDTNHFDTGF